MQPFQALPQGREVSCSNTTVKPSLFHHTPAPTYTPSKNFILPHVIRVSVLAVESCPLMNSVDFRHEIIVQFSDFVLTKILTICSASLPSGYRIALYSSSLSNVVAFLYLWNLCFHSGHSAGWVKSKLFAVVNF